MGQIDQLDSRLSLLLNNRQVELADYIDVQTTLTNQRSVLTQILLNKQLSLKAKQDILDKQQEVIKAKEQHVQQLERKQAQAASATTKSNQKETQNSTVCLQ